MTFYHSSPSEVIQELESDLTSGLRSDQVQNRIAQFGENKLKEKKRKSNFQRFLAQFKDVMILILLAAAAISFVIACVEGQPKEFFEPLLILLIVVLNAIMGACKKVKQKRLWMHSKICLHHMQESSAIVKKASLTQHS